MIYYTRYKIASWKYKGFYLCDPLGAAVRAVSFVKII